MVGHNAANPAPPTEPRRLPTATATAPPTNTPTGQAPRPELEPMPAERRRGDAAPYRRCAPLAVLPVFVDLQGRRAVVAGASAAAAWKAELLAAAGAEVDLYLCPDNATATHAAAHAAVPDPALTALLEHGAAAGALRMRRRRWHADDFAGAAVAVADAADDTEARAFHEAARAAGVPVNVIDRPAYCQFQFGAIVNRSPVVVGISTGGAAPVLAQTIRRRIETLLPPTLADWAALARRLRARIGARLPAGPARRGFWERFGERAFGPPPGADDEQRLLRAGEAAADRPERGRVTLVGAGPGDAALLTLKAVRALQAADVILFDDLVSDEILELARREAKRMPVGKRGGRESCSQQTINDTMVALARAGHRVVRLKSGDPMIFGRAGEEIERLRGENIAVEVVPGVTSALALAARLGVSLTHRDLARSVRFITGHSRHGRLPDDIDWRAAADPRTTTIFYMGGRTASQIADRLIDAGLPSSTPVAIACAVARAEERRWSGTLATLTEGIAEIGYRQPVLIAVGQVFAASASGIAGAARQAV